MKVTEALRERLAAIEWMVFDVDGVLPQGDIIYTDQGVEAKAFDAKDGLGLRVASSAGLGLAVMTGRSSRGVGGRGGGRPSLRCRRGGGGEWGGREAVEAVLQARGRWEEAVDTYLEALAERERSRRAIPGK